MMFSTLASIVWSWPGIVGSCTGSCDQSTVAGGALGEKVERHEHGSGQQVSRPQLRADSMSHHRVDQPSAHGCEIRPSRQVENLDAESLRVQMDSHRHRELSGFGVELRANIGHLADRNAAELDRRAGRQPANRVLEDELVGLRMLAAAA